MANNNSNTPTDPPPTNQDNDPSPSQPFSCIYFGFASNLSPRTIKQRCPSAMYAGLALLKGWRFTISELGFGNIVPGSPSDIVYGSLNFLSQRDEDALDKSEEVPDWHEKVVLRVVRVTVDQEVVREGQEVEVTTYVDVKRIGEGVISKDYIVWLRKAVGDGLRAGVPKGYFERYVERFLPADETVGREEQIMMIRTMQMDKEDTGHVPSHMLKMVGEKAG